MTTETARYTVARRAGCVLIYGEIPLDDMGALFKLVPRNAEVDPDVASMANATVAMGMPEDLKRLRESLAPASIARERAKFQGSLSEAAIRWLGGGERGISSNTIFTHITGVDALAGWTPCHQLDPADLRRCRLLLEQCPEIAERFDEMRSSTKEWARLVDAWEVICETMDRESPKWRNGQGSAPKTYGLMKKAIGY